MVNLKSADQCILGNSSTERVYAPNIFIQSSAVALHCAMKCTGVSSSSWQRGHRASCFRPITLRCRLRLPCPLSSPIKVLKRPLSSLKAYQVRLLFNPVKNNFACLQPLHTAWTDYKTGLHLCICPFVRIIMVAFLDRFSPKLAQT